jgi:hypothetical protein
MSVEHPSERLLRRYAGGDEEIPGDELWAVESHLETCAACRTRLSDTVGVPVVSMVDTVWADLEPLLGTTPRMEPRRSWRPGLAAWIPPAAGPWLTMILAVAFFAVVLDRLSSITSSNVSLLLLVAPVLPVLGVAAAWGRALDPAFELIASTPRAGLQLVFRRTAAVLVVVIPSLFAAGWAAGAGVAQWLLPCLAFTTGTLALGGLVGVQRAAGSLVALWAAVIVAPAVALNRNSFALDPGTLPVWSAIFALGVAVLVVRRGDFTHLGAHR